MRTLSNSAASEIATVVSMSRIRVANPPKDFALTKGTDIPLHTPLEVMPGGSLVVGYQGQNILITQPGELTLREHLVRTGFLHTDPVGSTETVETALPSPSHNSEHSDPEKSTAEVSAVETTDTEEMVQEEQFIEESLLDGRQLLEELSELGSPKHERESSPQKSAPLSSEINTEEEPKIESGQGTVEQGQEALQLKRNDNRLPKMEVIDTAHSPENLFLSGVTENQQAEVATRLTSRLSSPDPIGTWAALHTTTTTTAAISADKQSRTAENEQPTFTHPVWTNSQNAVVSGITPKPMSSIALMIDDQPPRILEADDTGEWQLEITDAQERTYQLAAATSTESLYGQKDSDIVRSVLHVDRTAPDLTREAGLGYSNNRAIISLQLDTPPEQLKSLILFDGTHNEPFTHNPIDDHWSVAVQAGDDAPRALMWTATDLAGNSQSWQVSWLITASPSVQINDHSLQSASAQPHLYGTGINGHTVRLTTRDQLSGDTLEERTTSVVNGEWSIHAATVYSPGKYTLLLSDKTEDDALAKSNTPPVRYTLTVTGSALCQPDTLPQIQTSPLWNNLNSPLAISGTAQPNSTVTLNIDGYNFGDVAVQSSGKWHSTLSSSQMRQLDNRDTSLTVTVTTHPQHQLDSPSSCSGFSTLNIDTAPPSNIRLVSTQSRKKTPDFRVSFTEPQLKSVEAQLHDNKRKSTTRLSATPSAVESEWLLHGSRSLPGGNHYRLDVRVDDLAGNSVKKSFSCTMPHTGLHNAVTSASLFDAQIDDELNLLSKTLSLLSEPALSNSNAAIDTLVPSSPHNLIDSVDPANDYTDVISDKMFFVSLPSLTDSIPLATSARLESSVNPVVWQNHHLQLQPTVVAISTETAADFAKENIRLMADSEPEYQKSTTVRVADLVREPLSTEATERPTDKEVLNYPLLTEATAAECDTHDNCFTERTVSPEDWNTVDVKASLSVLCSDSDGQSFVCPTTWQAEMDGEGHRPVEQEGCTATDAGILVTQGDLYDSTAIELSVIA